MNNEYEEHLLTHTDSDSDSDSDTESVTDGNVKTKECGDKMQSILGWYIFNLLVVSAVLMGLSDGELSPLIQALFGFLQQVMPAPQAFNGNGSGANETDCVIHFIAPCTLAGDSPIRGITPDSFVVGEAALQAVMVIFAIISAACSKYNSPMKAYVEIQKGFENAFGTTGLGVIQFSTMTGMVVRGCFDESGGGSTPSLAIAALIQIGAIAASSVKNAVKGKCCKKEADQSEVLEVLDDATQMGLT